MTNRQDRRFAAKLARQMQTRGKTPAERAIFQAAGAFFAEETVEIDFGLEGFDAAFARLSPELDELLDGGFDAFRREVFAQAAWAGMAARLPDGGEGTFDLQPILFAATGTAKGLTGFAGDAKSLATLARSLRESGVFPEAGAVAILPVVLAPDAVDLYTVGPAAVHALTEGLAALVEADTPEAGLAAAREALAQAGLPTVGEGEAEVEGLLLGICLTPVEDWDLPDAEVEARQLAMAATRASWLDTYAATLPFRLDEPVFWHEAASSLAFHALAGRIEADLASRGVTEPVSRIDACLAPETGDPVLAVQAGTVRLGPFHAPRDLVFTDIDGFAGLAERYAGELVEHERPGQVLRLVAGA
ncbi:hypothetical protein [Aureimonas sp. Leaf324]|jgi:hypothetical protein|uniref:hypothetical protein n=1 Tax=Aureimonas sp. Leaf324 TaxID=1736336 RepID=UPI0006F5D018|nr:hypothetical protein [Aureimonas sp. Leaf324]KQQ90294.1 hypothetical protein ASF65_15725 [Aureimonas sp. Leaf324]